MKHIKRALIRYTPTTNNDLILFDVGFSINGRKYLQRKNQGRMSKDTFKKIKTLIANPKTASYTISTGNNFLQMVVSLFGVNYKVKMRPYNFFERLWRKWTKQ